MLGVMCTDARHSSARNQVEHDRRYRVRYARITNYVNIEKHLKTVKAL